MRADTAGCSQAFLAHIRSLRQDGIDTYFSVGVPVTEPVRDAITAATGWIPALQADGDLRDGAEIAEITHLVAATVLAAFPTGTRLIARRERPHPGAQLDLFDTVEGMRHQVIATDTRSVAGRSSTSRSATAATPGSKTASAAARTPASAGSRRASSRSTPPG